MKDKKRKDRCNKVTWFAVGSALTVAGFVIIPQIIQKYGNKAYKKLLKNDEIDFENMGPEIVPFNKDAKEEE